MDEDRLRSLLTESGEDELLLDEVFDLLSDRHVRHTVFYLSDHSTASLDQLADVVTGLEAAEEDVITTQADRERIRNRLYHVVLPKLDDYGYVEFDADDQTVTETAIPPVIHALVGIDEDR